MSAILTHFTESVKASVDRTSLVASDWICRNFRHPKDVRQNWSFKDHEYQIEIANQGDDVQSVDIEKCAQVGASTLQINVVLTFLAQHDYLKAAYVLPTAKFATEFSALRFAPAIVGSTIADMVSKETDNTGMKKIGTCFLIMRGTTGENQAISVDLDMTVIDEKNFCNQKVLSAFSSRMQHSTLKLSRTFSTPTLPKFGISKSFDESSSAVRAVKCDHCGTWVFPEFFNDVVIPGFDKPLSDYRKGDHFHPGVQEAYLACSSCSKELTIENLNDPAKREWVHKYPNRLNKGYSVKPWDVPVYNPIPGVLHSIKDYNYQDWNNFRLGQAFESSENSFLLETVSRNSIIRPVSIDALRSGQGGGYYYIGADLGKTNHIMIGKAASDGTLEIACACRVNVNQLLSLYGEANFGMWLKELFLATLGVKIVLDHSPSWEPALFLHSQLPEGQSFGAYYVSDQKGKLDIYDFNEKKGVVNINRTKHFDDLASAVNGGKVKFPYEDDPEMQLVKSHLSVMKKIKTVDAGGRTVETWESTSDEDHYAHALGYLWAAFSSVERRYMQSNLILPPMLTTVRMRG